MEELTAIETLTSIEQLRHKRANRRGHITRVQKRVTTSLTAELGSLIKAELDHNLKEAMRHIEMETAIQSRIQFLLASAPDNLKTEQEEGEKFDSIKERVASEAHLAVVARQVYGHCQALYRRLETLQSATNVVSSYHMDKVAKFSKEVDQLYIDAAETIDDPRIKPLIKHLTDGEQLLSNKISKAMELRDSEAAASSPASMSTPTRHPSYEPSLKIDLPKFDGRPITWHTFKTMFESVLDKRGKYLSEVEKTTLLVNSLETKEAKDVVNQYSAGGTDFNSSMKALTKHFGSIQVVYPLLVQTINEPEKFELSRKGLAKLHERIFKPYRHMMTIASDSLSQYLVQFAKRSFSHKLREEWDRHIKAREDLPHLDDLQAFIEALKIQLPPDQPDNITSSPAPATQNKAKPSKSPSPIKCPMCGDKHNLVRCQAFADLDTDRRSKIVKDKRVCTNCLGEGHVQKSCPSKYSCRTCHQRHHTLLHKEKPAEDSSSASIPALFVGSQPSGDTEFLDTALVLAKSGSRHAKSRLLLDSGAGASFITENLAAHLHLKRHPARNTFSGADGDFICSQKVQVELSSVHDESASITADCYVVSKIPTSAIPGNHSQIVGDQVVKDLNLADPDLGGAIDIILSNKGRRQCVLSHAVEHKPLELGLTKTIFGWTVSGPLKSEEKPPVFVVQTHDEEFDDAIQTLWELDRVAEKSKLSSDEEQAVELFKKTHRVAQDGRYIVKLPKKLNAPTLGDSRQQAIKRFIANERSLEKKGKLPEFQKVLNEYTSLGHAEQVPVDQLKNSLTYYLPIQGVFKSSSTTTKCRAVFDASARTTTGYSLNDTLLTGPNLYPLLADVLVRFRSHRIAVSADISKMFREIWLHPEDRDLHRFFIRDCHGKLIEFRMTRLTFGVRTSPYIATQVLRQLADDNHITHPDAAKAIRENFYVDDFLSGAETVDEADHIRLQLSDLLSRAGMTLRKWRSNSTELKDRIPDDLKETEDLELTPPAMMKKALGIHWDSNKDTIHISTPVSTDLPTITKKVIASVTAQVFDILGLFAPAIIPAKILMQALWKLKLSWTKPVPDDVLKKWSSWLSHLSKITEYSISRRLTKNDSPVIFKSLHGFADASSVAYGAAIYLRQVHKDGSTSVSLVTAKARVLPIKEITIPRAELVAAHLLSKMLTHVAELLEISTPQIFAWTDSATVLHWLSTPPHRLHTFVANRIASISEHLPHANWRHVRSKDNPADLLSRGMYASDLVQSSPWWDGPPWLISSPEHWPPLLIELIKNPPEIKTFCLTITTPLPDFVGNYSSFFKLSRVIARIYRFFHNARLRCQDRKLQLLLAWEEVANARIKLINLAQQQIVPEVIKLVNSGKPLPRTHQLARLNLWIDEKGTLKVLCRVQEQKSEPKQLTYMPIRSQVTRLLISSLHTKYGHPGTSALVAIVSDSYFIPGLRNFVKAISRSCPTCQRAYQRTMSYQMGMLPPARTEPAPAFSLVGVDFAGPLTMKSDKLRKPSYLKVYVAVFICLTTKAVHLDICKGLSTEEFMATLRRFVNRRGVPAHVYSDNGTNFVGTKNEIEQLVDLLKSKETQSTISRVGSEIGFHWHNIPPRAPHFGGLWEAAVRRMKTLLRKQMSPHCLTYDEIYTLLTEAEAIMNSTPLTPIHRDDVNEDLCLTPGHFLIGRPMKSPLTKPPGTAKLSNLRRWHLTERISQDLWENWSRAYLQSLHQRAKWHSQQPNVRVGDVVFLRDETLPYRMWPRARIIKVYPGPDGVIRTVDLQCGNKQLTRTVNRLIPCVTAEDSTDQPTSNFPAPENVQDS